jgi:hypothetical protein
LLNLGDSLSPTGFFFHPNLQETWALVADLIDP